MSQGRVGVGHIHITAGNMEGGLKDVRERSRSVYGGDVTPVGLIAL